MAVNVVIAGTTYAFPTEGEENWGTVVTNWAVAVSSQLLQRTGGTFTLTNDVNFGATFATIQAYIKSRTSNISSAGFVRMARADAVSWRNQANDGNLALGVDSSNRLTFNGNVIIPSTGVIQPTEGGTGISSYTTGDTLYASASNVLSKLSIGSANKVYTSNGTIPGWALLVNANIDAAAAIAYSKLSLTGGIVDADVNASAALAFSKMAALTASKLLESSAGGVVVVATDSGYPKLTSGTPAYSSTIPRADVANGTADHVLINSGAGAMSSEATLAVTRGGTNLASYSTGDLLYASDATTLSKRAIGTTGDVLTVSGGVPTWASAAAAQFFTGAMIDYAGVTAPTGWVLASGLTIGNASSNATARANADTADLFALLWDNYSNTILPILDSAGVASTRGANAAADFAANKAMPVPDLRGRVAVGKDNMGGTTASRITNAGCGIVGTTLGVSGGSQSHTLVTGEIPSHTHIQDAHTHSEDNGYLTGVSGTGTNTVAGGTAVIVRATVGSTTATNQNTGGGGAHFNVQPTWVVNKLIHL